MRSLLRGAALLLICCCCCMLHSASARALTKDPVEHVMAGAADVTSAEILVPENYFALPKSARQVTRLVEGLRKELLCRVLDQRSRHVLLLPCAQLQPRHHVILHSSRKQRRQQQQQQAPCRHDLTPASSTQQLQQLSAFLQQHACVDEETRHVLQQVSKLVARGIGHGRRHHKLRHLQCDVMLAYENCKRQASTTASTTTSTTASTTTSTTTTAMETTRHQSIELHQTPVTSRSRFDWDISNIDYDGELFEDPFLFY